ncbi:AMP-binding protein [Chitinibacteraceae bacterium HSL-7]
MNQPWLASYPDTVAHTIDETRLDSIDATLRRTIARYPDRASFINMGRSLSYSELDARVDAFASYLQHTLKLARGSRIAIMLPNVLQYPIAMFGALRAGLTVVNVNPLYTPRELEHQLKDSGAEAIVILANFAHTLEEVLAHTPVKHVIVTQLGDQLGGLKGCVVNLVVRYIKKLVPAFTLSGHTRFNDALAMGRQQRFQPVDIAPNDPAFLQYTGGTTGVAKGAVLTHRNVLANMEQAYTWVQGALEDGVEMAATPLPLYHIFSLTVNCMLFIRLGGSNLLITNPRDLAAVIKDLRTYPVTAMTAVNTLFAALANHKDFATLDFSRLKVWIGGGAAIQSAVAERWQALTGKPIIEGYGLTEASPIVCCNPLNIKQYSGMIGLPFPSTDIEIRADDGTVLPIGQPGELFARGPQVMQGYWQRADETAKVLGDDGFLATGDIAVLHPTGFVQIVDRKKDLILVSGFNVYPNEIEAVLAEHPDVVEAAVIGVPDETTGEAIRAYVVSRNPALKAEELITYCREKLTRYKVPKQFEFRSELPKSNVGKILRRALRD